MSHTMLRKTAALTLAASALALADCKPKAAVSESKSIGTATGAVTEAQRAAQLCGPGAAQHAGDAQGLLDANWGALPPRLRDEFKGSRYRPLVADNTEEVCAQAAAGRGTPTAYRNTCYRVERDDRGTMFPRLVLPNDASALNATFLMAAMTTYVDFFIDASLGPASDKATLGKDKLSKAEQQIAGFVSMFRRARKALAAAFVDDLREASMEQALGKMAGEFHVSPEALAESVDFQNYVLVHVGDSYYCNADTARELNLNYLKRTRGAFLAFVDFFGAPWFASETAAKGTAKAAKGTAKKKKDTRDDD